MFSNDNGKDNKNILFNIKKMLMIIYIFMNLDISNFMPSVEMIQINNCHPTFFDINRIRINSQWGKKYNNNLLNLIKKNQTNSFCIYEHCKIFYLPRSQILVKPVIYIYTEKPMDVKVQLNLKNSKFRVVYPNFTEENTWNVYANQNGDILTKGRKYPYLFWEAESYTLQEMNEGFVVTAENAENFLEEKLKIFGLNERESTDFITFWLPVLYRNKLSLCTFQTGKFFDNIELKITPKPKTRIRICLSIKKIYSPIKIIEQKLTLIERKGFTVVEWGGSIME